MREESNKCPTCGRQSGDKDGACRGDETCGLTRDVNSLLVVCRRLASACQSSMDRPEFIAALAVMESISPSRSCPLCGQNSVRDGVVSVHFANVTDTRPCEASYGSVVGGFLIKK